MAYQIEWNESGVFGTFAGIVTAQDIFAFNDDIYGDIRFDSMHFQLIDLLAIEDFTVSEMDMKRIAATDAAASRWSAYKRRVRVAVATTHPKAIRMTQLYAASLMSYSCWEAQVFDDIEKARNWVAEA